MIAMTFIPLWYFGLRWVSRWRGSSLGAARFVVLPSDIFWMLPSIFAGLFSAILVVNHHNKRTLGARFPEFELYTDLLHRQQFNLLHRFDLKIVEACVGAVAILATGSLIAAGLNAHARFTEQTIMIKRGWSLFEGEYVYDRVRGCRREEDHRAERQDSGISALRDSFRRWHELEHKRRLLEVWFGSGQANYGIRCHESASAAPAG